jgi:hypothetical protein
MELCSGLGQRSFHGVDLARVALHELVEVLAIFLALIERRARLGALRLELRDAGVFGPQLVLLTTCRQHQADSQQKYPACFVHVPLQKDCSLIGCGTLSSK